MKKLTYVALLTFASACMVDASCPAVCKCPTMPQMCPAGVSLMFDGCGCCKVCAAQLNQDCNTHKPCDHHKGLECNYGNDVMLGTGICRAKLEGRSCEYNGRMYQNGESFRMGCKHQCTCIDGAVGCGPLCTTNLPLSSPSCPYPRLVRVPGQCCFSVDCHKGAIAPLMPPWKTKQQANGPLDKSENVLGNELWERRNGWEDEQGYKHLPNPFAIVQTRCVVQTTDWSPCSSSCGMGVSSRVTNNNGQCKLERETRLCNVRPCSPLAAVPKKGKKCTRMQKSRKPVHLSYAGCRSVQAYKPNYCGVCTDGRCCVPRRTRTASVLFQCPGGGSFDKAVMFIYSCKCGQDCGHLNEAAMPPQKWLYGDTHKFID
ncbi:CCN family member 1 [Ictalurus punctatus]|uniref:CCN family member 1 n=1 Tax=Ictalurus punctatus TaxID=7998 RepID=A0A2D0Q5M6_ICTPU|nr:CCN family member 1 [Ictalurus punctatus]